MFITESNEYSASASSRLVRLEASTRRRVFVLQGIFRGIIPTTIATTTTTIITFYILAIPASSATSERVFSAGGLMVSSKRTNLAEDTVEDLLMIKLNLEKVENLEKMGGGKTQS